MRITGKHGELEFDDASTDGDLQFWDTNYHHAQFIYYEGTGNGDDHWMLQCRCGFRELSHGRGNKRAERARAKHDALDPWMTPMSIRDARRTARRIKIQQRPWRVHFDLAYDGGGGAHDEYFRSLWRARWAAWARRRFPYSWGGSAEIFVNRMEES